MNIPKDDPIYALAPGVAAVPLPGDQLLFRSDTLALRIEGGFARVLQQRVLPLLDGRTPFSAVAARLPDLPPDRLRERLETLVQSQVLRQVDTTERELSGALGPLLTLAESFGVAIPDVLARLRALRIVVAGLEGHGAHLAALLARCGVGGLRLLDPFPCAPGNVALLPPSVGANLVGVPRQEVVAAALRRDNPNTHVETGGAEPLTRERVAELARGCHLLIGCFDRGFAACHHWLNRAGAEQGIPSLYAESRAHTALVGPLVLPGQTACFLCYRMRSIACEDDFEAAMGYEEFLDREKRPALHERGVLPTMPPYIASVLGLEALKYLLLLGQPILAGSVLEFNALTLAAEIHPVLQKPDCPVCGAKKKDERRPHPLTAEARRAPETPGDLAAAISRLHSARTGIVRQVHLVPQDADEPAKPYVLGAELANHRFLTHEPREQRMCSGKGLTEHDARLSTFGEAVERYGGACWDGDEITYARRSELPGASLDPQALVLYTPDQYADLPYQPYTGDNVLGWVPARSLVSGDWISVPAQALFLNYAARSPDEFLCPITSNGLAAGPTILDAVLAAAGEVLERDAFLIAWMNRLPCARIAPKTHPDPEMCALCEAYRRRDVELRLYRMPADHPCHVFASVALQTGSIRDDTPAAVVGLGADFDAARAARKALLEIGQVRPALRHRLRRPETQARRDELVADPHRVTTLDDHDLLYASPRALGALDFWLDRPLESFGWNDSPAPPASVPDRLDVLADCLRAQNSDLIYANLTPPDMAALGLHTVRAILPDYQPIHFGWKEPRLGGNRLYALPHKLGLAPERTTPAQLNDAPHPLA